MPESFVAYIDESGCTGFKFDKGSSEWFVLAAVIVRRKNEPLLLSAIKDLRSDLRLQRTQNFHFHKQSEAQRATVLTRLASMPVRVVAVAFHKPSMTSSFKASREQMFNYAARMCVERVSWLCTKHAKGTKEVELVFSRRKQMKKAELKAYFDLLKMQDTSIKWDSVCSSRLRVEDSEETGLLQMADYASSCVRYSFESSLAPQSYVHHLSANFYKHTDSVLGYGLKFLPPLPELQKAGHRCGSLPFT